jgi:hypothetical protein
MRWSAPLHYIGALSDHPPDSCLFPGERGWAGRKGGNVLGAVRNTTDILRDWVATHDTNTAYDSEAANEALKFLIHFLGDLHMPLHLTGRDRGGNSVKVRFSGRITSKSNDEELTPDFFFIPFTPDLHSLWDNLLIAKALRTVPRNYTRPLPLPQVEYSLRGAIYDPFVRRIMHQGILDMWRDEIPEWLSCQANSESLSRLRAPSGSYIRQHVVSVLGESTTEAVFDVGDETDDDVVCPYQWAKPIHPLNCDLVWPAELDDPPYNHQHTPQAEGSEEDSGCSEDEDPDGDELNSGQYLELDTPEYAGLIADDWVIEKLLAMAGLRLAGVLNYLFADDGLR